MVGLKSKKESYFHGKPDIKGVILEVIRFVALLFDLMLPCWFKLNITRKITSLSRKLIPYWSGKSGTKVKEFSIILTFVLFF